MEEFSFLNTFSYVADEEIDNTFVYDQAYTLNEKFKDIYKGKSCIIIGGGPSVLQLPINAIEGNYVVLTNAANYMEMFSCLRPFVVAGISLDLWMPITKALWTNLESTYPMFSRHFNQQRLYQQNLMNRMNIYFITSAINTYPGTDFNSFAKVDNTGIAAVQLAVIMGFKLIGLLGFDGYQEQRGNSNYHLQYDGLRPTSSQFYEKWILDLDSWALHLKEMNVEVLNLSSISKLQAYETVSIHDWNARSNNR